MISHHTAIFKFTEGEAILLLTGNAFSRRCNFWRWHLSHFQAWTPCTNTLKICHAFQNHGLTMPMSGWYFQQWWQWKNIYLISDRFTSLTLATRDLWLIRHFANVLMLGCTYFMLKVSLVTTQNVWKEGLLGKMVVQKPK